MADDMGNTWEWGLCLTRERLPGDEPIKSDFFPSTTYWFDANIRFERESCGGEKVTNIYFELFGYDNDDNVTCEKKLYLGTYDNKPLRKRLSQILKLLEDPDKDET